MAVKVTTRAAVSEASICDAAECSDMTNMSLLGAACDLSRVAMLRPNKQLAPKNQIERQALAWLQSVELAENGCLLPAAITAVTTISRPVNVSNDATAYGARQVLLEQGWALAKNGRGASAATRKLNPCQCSAYYMIILNRQSEVLAQENAGYFSHSQGHHYYTTLQAAFEATWLWNY